MQSKTTREREGSDVPKKPQSEQERKAVKRHTGTVRHKQRKEAPSKWLMAIENGSFSSSLLCPPPTKPSLSSLSQPKHALSALSRSVRDQSTGTPETKKRSLWETTLLPEKSHLFPSPSIQGGSCAPSLALIHAYFVLSPSHTQSLTLRIWVIDQEEKASQPSTLSLSKFSPVPVDVNIPSITLLSDPLARACVNAVIGEHTDQRMPRVLIFGL